MLDLAPIRALLNIHMGRGASKAALHAHILAYEHLVPALLSELAATQAGPVVEWEDHPQVGLLGEDRSWSVAERGYFRLWVDVDGWHLLCSLPDMPANRSIASGSETGLAGKSAAEAAYRKAAGL